MTIRLISFGIVPFALVACTGVQPRFHRIAAGETLSKVAHQYQIPVAELTRYNEDKLARGLRTGTKLYIPFEKSPNWDEEVESEVFAAVRRPSEVTTSVPFSWPVVGWVSSVYGRRHRKMHDGIDIAAPSGTPVKAARSGFVIYAGSRIPGYGKMVILRHSDEYSSVYAHLSRITVKKGQFIARGKLVGKVGQTGRATGPHLHFEVRESREPKDPLLYLQGQYAANKIQGR